MRENFESKFGNIDDLLNEVEQSTSDKRLLAQIDDLCNEIDADFDHYKKEITEWSVERKRKEAMDSEDPFVLNLLSMDENFNVRTLSVCNPHIPEISLLRLVESSNDFMKMVIANNINCTADILDRISELSNDQEVREAVKANPNVSLVTRYKIEN